MKNQFVHAAQMHNEGNAWICPRCDRPVLDYPALSRKDDATGVCSRCGTEEAVREYEGKDPWPPNQVWPFILDAEGV